jgi:hypothetical protein
LINPASTGRKTPNPNVLIELGFAAKCIGWDHIICLFNTEFGAVEDLPFDLRFRRPITYRVDSTGNKSKERAQVSSILQAAISDIVRKVSAKEEVSNYLKGKIDKDVISICKDIFKIVFGYDKMFTNSNMWNFLQLRQAEFEQKLIDRNFFGFTVLKDWEPPREHLRSTMNEPFFVQHAHNSFTQPLVRIIRNLSLVGSILTNEKIFKRTLLPASGYTVIYGKDMNSDNPPDRYLLLKTIDADKGIVIDFGDFRPSDKDHLLFLQEPDEDFSKFSFSLHLLLVSLYGWIKATGNSILIFE